ncbi:MAG: bifunctional phosphopantothenoylcysteine decarboxylase/phosphopantothenate--cysteine ligase CoaBC [Luteococcus japonicus]|uniref:bifunctional phosphopantothenoylcysteine decarboxylase/phosphopantothenate--cysteine ligase CoaBC n=1 Tax=Luteococcus sp. TaxID=1969402 RepID=UPI002648A368|nr:bifunctional phosphopantothenoylcysteine decarboxylase/phosphopantothenate--cysteine ligase CoaBC [Luteococcus sp.]MDN5563606.1 bifunctional phosphopantothenoylcysteine decarboxylase/phosphopantothenate--cysteine ligase CoaBC [Luteococcus sp.]
MAETDATARRVVLGVAGGIAAYKACEVLRRLREAGCEVTVVPTANALNFVGRTTWEALSGRAVATDVWSDITEVPHVRLGQQADLVMVVPATADLLSRAATGRADDLLTNVLLTAHCPVVMFPAMHTEMWQHAATVANVATLRSRGVVVKDPDSGRLTGADSGPGRLPEPAEIAEIALQLLSAGRDAAAQAAARDLAGRHVVVSAGGTHEALDPVRFLGNSSSGLMGVAIAREAALRGARVTLVAANMQATPPSGVEVRRVVSTGDLARVMAELAPRANGIVMAAAPADFTPEQQADSKIKKDGDGGLTLHLLQTTDVLATLCRDRAADPSRAGQVVVGFAAETAPDRDELVRIGTAKLARKGCDLLVLNDVSGGKVFGQSSTHITVIDAQGAVAEVSGSKSGAARAIVDALSGRLIEAV